MWDWSTRELCEHDYFSDGDGCSPNCLLAWKTGEYGVHRYIWSDYDDCEVSRCYNNWVMDDLCDHRRYRDYDGDCLRHWHALRTCVHSYELCATCCMKAIDGGSRSCNEMNYADASDG